ncbi:DUF4416 family protein [Chloroflexota bacterium]
MGTARQPDPVKLIVSLLTADTTLLIETRGELSRLFGAVDSESELLPFDHTDYYAPEFGSGLQRQILSFEVLVEPSDLPAIKVQTNALESSLAEGGHRRVNIDPGYVTLGKLVLASTKDHAHRIYLQDGVYAEGTLTFQRGRFRSWPWTYPDYGSDRYSELFYGIRERYKAQLRSEKGS